MPPAIGDEVRGGHEKSAAQQKNIGHMIFSSLEARRLAARAARAVCLGCAKDTARDVRLERREQPANGNRQKEKAEHVQNRPPPSEEDCDLVEIGGLVFDRHGTPSLCPRVRSAPYALLAARRAPRRLGERGEAQGATAVKPQKLARLLFGPKLL